eukprot:2532895-Rhodomonas_salina.1
MASRGGLSGQSPDVVESPEPERIAGGECVQSPSPELRVESVSNKDCWGGRLSGRKAGDGLCRQVRTRGWGQVVCVESRESGVSTVESVSFTSESTARRVPRNSHGALIELERARRGGTEESYRYTGPLPLQRVRCCHSTPCYQMLRRSAGAGSARPPQGLRRGISCRAMSELIGGRVVAGRVQLQPARGFWGPKGCAALM